MKKAIRRLVIAGSLVLAAIGVYWGCDHRHYWLDRNFREVDGGRVYAGGYQYATPLKRILNRHRIKTVLSLLPANSPGDIAEREIVTSSDVQFKRVVIPVGMNFGSQEQSLAAKTLAVEEAVAVLADERYQPVFVHCEGGKHRVGAVVAIYRVRHCGWTEESALAELARYGGFERGTKWPALLLHRLCRRLENDPATGLGTRRPLQR